MNSIGYEPENSGDKQEYMQSGYEPGNTGDEREGLSYEPNNTGGEREHTGYKPPDRGSYGNEYSEADSIAGLEETGVIREKNLRRMQTSVIRFLILLFIIWILFFLIVGLKEMPTGDMYPRIDAGDLLLYYRLDKDVNAQDIIVINKEMPDTGEEETFVSRVVAVQGDTVDITDEGGLVINGNTMIETNIFYSTPRYQSNVEYPLTLGEEECFVLADSREEGTDSRYFGAVRKSEIAGTVIMINRRNNL